MSDEWRMLGYGDLPFDVEASFRAESWHPSNVTEAEQVVRDFAACMDNFAPPFSLADVRRLTIVSLSPADDEEWWTWVVDTLDTRWVVIGQCDYTGWDCRADVEFFSRPKPEAHGLYAQRTLYTAVQS